MYRNNSDLLDVCLTVWNLIGDMSFCIYLATTVFAMQAWTPDISP